MPQLLHSPHLLSLHYVEWLQEEMPSPSSQLELESLAPPCRHPLLRLSPATFLPQTSSLLTLKYKILTYQPTVFDKVKH